MKLKASRILNIIATIALLITVGACSSTQKSNVEIDNTLTPRETTGVYQSLADYLRRLPSVRIIGNGEDTQVFIRGLDNVNGEIEPLFVINGSPVGESYALATRLVDVNDIKSVRALNIADATSQYGLRGNRGAIVIRTKNGR